MTSEASSHSRFGRLRLFNLAMGAVHAAQGVAVFALSTDFSLPVTATFLQGPPGVEPPQLTEWFDVRLGPAVVA